MVKDEPLPFRGFCDRFVDSLDARPAGPPEESVVVPPEGSVPGSPEDPMAGGGGGTPGSADPPPGGGGGDGSGGGRKVPRSRLVLYTSLAVGVVVAILIALLASSKSGSPGAAGSPLIGRTAPEVAGSGLSGGPGDYSLATYRGKWVLVNFSASWCVPCRQETPQLIQFAAEHQSPGDAVILAVSFDPTDKANLAAFLRSSHATWPAVDDPQAQVAYGVTGIPESYLVAPNGIVAAKFIGGVTSAEIDSFIKRVTPAPGA
ncbi:MAG: TlpA family protein disulfide reductase [Acidimicrobiales bacterium]|nr:TlpA family protein disulfide reductase [Acidimicrobiales bacterium]